MKLRGDLPLHARWIGGSTKIVFACRENAANGVGCAIVNCDPAQYNPAAIAAFDLGIGVIRDRAKCENELTGVIHTSTHDIQYVMTAGLAQRADTAGSPNPRPRAVTMYWISCVEV